MNKEKFAKALTLAAKYVVSLALLFLILGPVFVTFFASV